MKMYSELEIKEKIENGENVVIDFYADWCGPCKMLIPILDEIETNYPNVEFIKVNVDEYSSYAVSLGIRSVPTVMFFNNKELKYKFSGLQNKKTIEDNLSNVYGN